MEEKTKRRETTGKTNEKTKRGKENRQGQTGKGRIGGAEDNEKDEAERQPKRKPRPFHMR